MSTRGSGSKNHNSTNKNETENTIEPDDHRKPPHANVGEERKKPSPLIEGRERTMHEKLINRRITGGVKLSDEAIAKAYDRSLRQWQELPGSIVRPPTDVIPSQKLLKSQEILTTSEQTDNGTDKGEESE
jgi:hypothetical protein